MKYSSAADPGVMKWIGIGVIVDVVNKDCVVLTVIQDGPAQAAGIQQKDLITAINDQPVAGLSLPEVLDRLRGELNSTVKVTVSRTGSPNPLNFTILRKPIHVDEWPREKTVD